MRKYTKIAYDIDGVCLDFAKHTFDFYNIPFVGYDKLYDWDSLTKYIPHMNYSDFDKNFWLTMPRHDNSTSIINPSCYLTARKCNTSWSKQCLIDNGFPNKSVFNSTNKLKFMIEYNIDILVDDKPKTFLEVNKHPDKICILYNAKYNEHIKTHLRINQLQELPTLLKSLNY